MLLDIALQTLKNRLELAGSGIVLGLLARKPDAFLETKSNIIWRNINSGRTSYLYTHMHTFMLAYIYAYIDT